MTPPSALHEVGQLTASLRGWKRSLERNLATLPHFDVEANEYLQARLLEARRILLALEDVNDALQPQLNRHLQTRARRKGEALPPPDLNGNGHASSSPARGTDVNDVEDVDASPKPPLPQDEIPTAETQIMPFTEVVRSPLIPTHVKSAAVEGVNRIVAKLRKDDPGASQAVLLATESILECRFEQTNSSADEIALISLLETLSSCVKSAAGRLLTDEVLFRVGETMIDASVAPFNTETVRFVALRLACEMIEVVFSHSFPSVVVRPKRGDGDANERTNGEEDGRHVGCARRLFTFLVEMSDPCRPAPTPTSRLVAMRLLSRALDCAWTSEAGSSTIPSAARDEVIFESIANDLTRCLIQIAQRELEEFSPQQQQQQQHLHHQQQQLSTYSFATTHSSSTASLHLLSQAMQLSVSIFGCRALRRRLGAQFEVFFNGVFVRVLERKGHHGEETVVVLEGIANLLRRDEGLLSWCYANYDCDPKSADVFEGFFKVCLLCFPRRLSVPAVGDVQNAALKCLLAGMRSLAVPVALIRPPPSGPRHALLSAAKARKTALKRCVQLYNEKPKKGIRALQEMGFLDEQDPDPAALANFLRNTPGLDRAAVGEFLGEAGALNTHVLRAYTETFDLRRRTLLEGLRMFLETFRLPKEAQQIDRVLQSFADVAFAQCADAPKFPSVDACFVLCFAIIILNTDLHNPNVRPEKRMTLAQFLKSNTNYGPEVSKGVDLPPAWLTQIYVEISEREINVMRDANALTALLTTDRWCDVLVRGGAKVRDDDEYDEDAESEDDARMFLPAMLEVCWNGALAAFSVVFDAVDRAEQPQTLRSALDGFITLAKLSSRAGNTDAFDGVVSSLCKFTTLLSYSGRTKRNKRSEANSSSSSSSLSDASGGETEGEEVSTTAPPEVDEVEEGRRFVRTQAKGQLAALTVFALARTLGDSLGQAWSDVLRCALRLGEMRLLDEEVFGDMLGSPPTTSASAREADVEAEEEFRAARGRLRAAVGARMERVRADRLRRRRSSGGKNSSLSSSSSATSNTGGLLSWLFWGSSETGEIDTTQSSSRPLTSLGETHGPGRRATLAFVAESCARRFMDSRLRTPSILPPSPDCISALHVGATLVPHPEAGITTTGALARLLAALTKVVQRRSSDLLAPPTPAARFLTAHWMTRACVINASRLTPQIRAEVESCLFELLEEGEVTSTSTSFSAPSANGPAPPTHSVRTLSREEERLAMKEIAAVGVVALATSVEMDPEESMRLLDRLLRAAVGFDCGVEAYVGFAAESIVTRRILLTSSSVDGDGKLPAPNKTRGWCESIAGVVETLAAVGMGVSGYNLPPAPTSRGEGEGTSETDLSTASLYRHARGGEGNNTAPDYGFRIVSHFVRHGMSGREEDEAVADSLRAAVTAFLESRAYETAAIDLLYELQSHLRSHRAWIGAVRELSAAAQNLRLSSSGRRRALHALSRACLECPLVPPEMGPAQWGQAVQTLVFPVCQFAASRAAEEGDCKYAGAAADFAVKLFLRHAKEMARLEGFDALWLEMLQFLERFKQAGLSRSRKGEPDAFLLSETVGEAFKNLLLSLSAEGLLIRMHTDPATGERMVVSQVSAEGGGEPERLWNLTWLCLKKCEGLRSHLFVGDEERGQQLESSSSSSSSERE